MLALYEIVSSAYSVICMVRRIEYIRRAVQKGGESRLTDNRSRLGAGNKMII